MRICGQDVPKRLPEVIGRVGAIVESQDAGQRQTGTRVVRDRGLMGLPGGESEFQLREPDGARDVHLTSVSTPVVECLEHGGHVMRIGGGTAPAEDRAERTHGDRSMTVGS